MWSGYSVDKHGSYRAGGSLILLTQDPKKRPFWRVPGRFEKKELEDHLVELFPEGLSPHGWRFMLDRYEQRAWSRRRFAIRAFDVERQRRLTESNLMKEIFGRTKPNTN